MAGRPLTYDHLKSRKKPTVSRLPLCLDSDVADKLRTAEVEEVLAREAANERPQDRQEQIKLSDAQDALQAAREAAEQETVVFVFKSIGRPRWDALLDEHPATSKQRDELRKQGVTGDLNYNADTFPQALVAASLTDPALTEDEVNDMFNSEEWNSGELTGLFETALMVNQQRRVVNLRKDIHQKKKHKQQNDN